MKVEDSTEQRRAHRLRLLSIEKFFVINHIFNNVNSRNSLPLITNPNFSMTIEPANQHSSTGSESEVEQGAPSVLAALQTFKATQERRVATWSEYEDAIRVHLNTSQSNSSHVESQNDAGERRTKDDEENDQISSSQGLQECSHSHGNGASHDHYQSPQSINNNVMSEILRLVTSSLLDCSHESRVIQTELETKFQRKDLSDLVGRIQDLENKLLRNIVERDQIRKIDQLRKEEGQVDEDQEGEGLSLEEREKKLEDEKKVEKLEKEIGGIKEEIEDQMMEIRAELAELEDDQ